MADASETYAIDASSLLTLDEVFDDVQREEAWGIVERLAREGRLKTHQVVLDEVKCNSRAVFQKVNRLRTHILVPIDPILLAEAGRIAHRYPIMSHIDRDKDSGDPWVLAIGKVMDCKVICEESKIKEQRMAWACTRDGIRCGNIHEMLRANGMSRKT